MQHHAVHLLLLRQIKLYGCRHHTIIGSPISIVIIIRHGLSCIFPSSLVRNLSNDTRQKIMCQLLLNIFMEIHCISRVNRMNQSISVYRKIQQQSCIVTHTAIVEVCQLFYCLHTIIFLRMIEPSRTNGNITLCCHPLITVSMTVLQFSIFRITGINLSGTQE